ncbi:SBBP repeat-containing protein [Allochromatium palmeri]|uniref:DUF7948 domain-containing protein n=1 Tax=Allochromatium palmeri TaxID=231048 RepID=UPI0016429E06|nr:SBBP repeat-containing protein [Allochromatium palmeri]
MHGLAPNAHASSASTSLDHTENASAPPRLTDFPLFFVPNRGQWDDSIAYLARIEGADVLFGAQEAIIHVHGTESSAPAVRLRPLAPDSGMNLTPGRALHTRMSYFVGNDPSRWRAGIQAHDSVRYQAIYPGIDLVFRGDGQRLVYDLELAPGADPSQVRLAVSGIKTLALDAAGNLVMTLPDGSELRQQVPHIYQEVAGERIRIDGGFSVLDTHSDDTHVFGFHIASYDTRLALVIDPTLSYSTFHGGSADDEVKAMAITASGKAVVVGSTLSTADTWGSTLTLFPDPQLGKREGLVYQVSADGSTIDYVVTIGGSLDDQVNALALWGTDVYLTGQTLSTDFPTALGADPALYRVLPGGQAAFIAKLSITTVSTTATPALTFATYFGGTGKDAGIAIGLDDPNGDAKPDNLYIGGDTTSTDLPTRTNLYPSFPGGTSLFILSLSPDGQDFRDLTYFGGSGNDNLKAMSVTDSGDIYLAGITSSSNFPTSECTYQAQKNSGTDGFVAKLAPDEELVFSTYLGGQKTDNLTGMVLDQSDNILLTGYTNSNDFPTHNALYPSLIGGYDAFVVKLDYSGRFVHFSTLIGGINDDFAYSIAVDQDNDNGLRYLYIGGETESNDFLIENPYQRDYTGNTDGFVVKMDPFGQRIAYSSFFGGLNDESVLALGVVPTTGKRAVYLAGNTSATDPALSLFPITTNAAQTTPGGKQDTFVALIKDTLYNSNMPRLALSSIADLYPEASVANINDKVVASIDLTLVNAAATGKDISAFSTVVHYDPEELRFDEVIWNTTRLPTAAIFKDVDAPELGELTLLLYQEASSPTAIGDGVRLATLKFEIRNIGDVAENPPRPSKGLRLTQSQATALNLSNQDVFIEGLPGDIMIIRPCNTLTGDCDCSGAVRFREIQEAAQELSTSSPATPRCMKINGTQVAMDITDMQRIINNYIYQVIESTCSVAMTQYTGMDASSAAWPSGLDIANLAAIATDASVNFGNPVSTDEGISTDLFLSSSGQEIAAVMVDLRYDPNDFSALAVTSGEVVRAAGKSLSFNIVEPGWMRILVYGLNDTAISDGVLGTLTVTPAVDLEQSSIFLEHTSTASSPDATPVSIQGDTLLAKFDDQPSTCPHESTLNLNSQTVNVSRDFRACDTIAAGSRFIITSTGQVVFEAGTRIYLQPGFQVQAGGRFTARINP